MASPFIIKKSFITEKAAGMAGDRKYIFLVEDRANKPEIKKTVEAQYKVHVVGVHVINTRPKERRRGKIVGVRAGFKKAIVTLKKGEKLDILSQ
jgi:large subunit ribosomal protein L23